MGIGVMGLCIHVNWSDGAYVFMGIGGVMGLCIHGNWSDGPMYSWELE